MAALIREYAGAGIKHSSGARSVKTGWNPEDQEAWKHAYEVRWMARGSFTTDGQGKKIDDPASKVWFHGSPHQIEVLAGGSSITRNRELAIAFSYKPSQLEVDNDGRITHNGTRKGYLYVVDEPISMGDVEVHPACSNDDPWEWVTKRPVQLRVLQV